MERSNFDQSANSEELRSGIRRLVVSVELADLLGFLMILATAFSAYSTWRTAELAGQLLLITARPYLGNAGVHFDRIDTDEPRVVADLRNFGSVQATDTTIEGELLFNVAAGCGKERTAVDNLRGSVLSQCAASDVLPSAGGHLSRGDGGQGRAAVKTRDAICRPQRRSPLLFQELHVRFR